MKSKLPCLAAVLVNPREPQSAASYLWCKEDEHAEDIMHNCYCGIQWLTDDLAPMTVNMIRWRTGSAKAIRRVAGRMQG